MKSILSLYLKKKLKFSEVRQYLHRFYDFMICNAQILSGQGHHHLPYILMLLLLHTHSGGLDCRPVPGQVQDHRLHLLVLHPGTSPQDCCCYPRPWNRSIVSWSTLNFGIINLFLSLFYELCHWDDSMWYFIFDWATIKMTIMVEMTATFIWLLTSFDVVFFVAQWLSSDWL